jgi:hypothetical protein
MQHPGTADLARGTKETVKFEVQYPNGTHHEVELQGTLAVLGRDPSCDLVLNDAKCSRKHAVLEAGPQGISVRDTGSANGVYVNGAKVERASVREGDLIRVGEVTLKVLPEEISGTVVMGPEDMAELRGDASDGRRTPRAATPPPPRVEPPTPPEPKPPPPPPRVAAPPPPPRRQAPAPPRPAPERPRPTRAFGPGDDDPIPRPLTVTVLAVLWILGVPLYGIGGLVLAYLGRDAGLFAAVPAVVGLGLALVCAVLGFGLWSRSPWGRFLQVAFAVLGLCSPFILTCVLILIYLMRPDVRIQFSGRRDFSDLAPSEARIVRESASDTVFALSILASVLVAALLSGLLAFFVGPLSQRSGPAPEARAIARLRAVSAAQDAFRAGTCDAYADLDGLIHPARVIPNYPAGGPPFLDERYERPEDGAYRFDLRVEEPVPPSEGCPARSFRRFVYAALPVSGTGPYYAVGPDHVVRTADGHPAGPEDSPAAVPQ